MQWPAGCDHVGKAAAPASKVDSEREASKVGSGQTAAALELLLLCTSYARVIIGRWSLAGHG